MHSNIHSIQMQEQTQIVREKFVLESYENFSMTIQALHRFNRNMDE